MNTGAEELVRPKTDENLSRSAGEFSTRTASTYAGSDDQTIDVRDLLKWCWRGKWLILLFLAIGAGYGAWKLHQHQLVFEAYLIIAPIKQLNSAPSQSEVVSRIATAVGAGNGGTNNSSGIDRLEIMVGSRRLAEQLQQQVGLLQILYSDSWDEESKTWKRPLEGEKDLRSRIRAFFNLPIWTPPSTESLAKHLDNGLQFEAIGTTEMKRVSYSHSDPEMATRVLSLVYSAVDNLLREQDRERLLEQRQYLLRNLERVEFQENRQILLGLLSRTMQSLMLLDNDLPYVAHILDPPRVPERAAPPNTLKVVGVPMVGAFVLSLIVVIAIALYRMEGR